MTVLLFILIKYKILILNLLFQTKCIPHIGNWNPPIPHQETDDHAFQSLATPFFEDCTLQNEVPLSSLAKPPGPPSACPLPPRLSCMLSGCSQDLEGTQPVPTFVLAGLCLEHSLLCHFLSAQAVCSSWKPSLHTPVLHTPITIMLLFHSTCHPTATVYYHKLLAGRDCVFVWHVSILCVAVGLVSGRCLINISWTETPRAVN